MNLAISNIAWTPEEEVEIAKLLQSMGVRYVEIAPTKTWNEPVEVSDADVETYKDFWAKYGIKIVAFQSMLFSHLDYTLFESPKQREVTKSYLKDFTILAGKIGAQRMVFGSPKNRQLGALNEVEAKKIAKDFFTDIAAQAEKEQVVFCIEPNAPQYNCDFVTNAREGIDLVRSVDANGFGLHLDIACMTLAGDDIRQSIIEGSPYLKHFHISSPMLDAVEVRDDVDHEAAAQALRDVKYDGFVSIEMRPGIIGENLTRVKTAVEMAQRVYLKD